jgi:signal transduction histidine kinase
MTWALGKECGCERLIEYEAKLNQFFPKSKSTAICQYNRKRFSPEIIRDVLRTHPVAILGDQVCPNLYFEDPKMVMGNSTVDDRVNWMVNQLKRFHSSEQGLKESIRARDEFLSVASHELKTPLTSLNFQIQLLERGILAASQDTLSSPQVAKRVDMAVRQTKRLSTLVDTLLDVSRANSSQITIDPKSTEVSSIVSEVIQRFADEARLAGVAFHFQPMESVYTEVDRLRFDQVLSNLFSNAIKYGNRKPVHVELQVDAQTVKILVRDQGIGINAEDQHRIFSRFERAVPAQSISGLGLGLFIANEIIKAHHGRICVESDPGNGSTFTVELPRKAERAKAIA